MSDDQECMRQIQDRLAQLQQQNTDLAPEAAQDSRPAASVPLPICPGQQSGKRRGWLFIATLVMVVFVFGELAITVQVLQSEMGP